MLFLKLTYFVKAVECRSFTQAAKELFVSQSTISKSIKNLEEILKVKLISRGNKDFTLTKQGKIVYDFAKDIIGNYEIKKNQMLDKLSVSDDTFRLGISPSAVSIFVSKKILKFNKKHPDIKLEIVENYNSTIIDKLLKNEIDIGVINSPFNDNRFYTKEIFKSEFVLAVNNKHRFAEMDSVDLKELCDERFLLVNNEFIAQDGLIEKCEKEGFTPNIVFESRDWGLLLSMVGEGEGIAILPKPWVDQHSLKNISAVNLKNPSFSWILMLVCLKDKIITDSMNSFLELFSKEYC